MSGRDGNEGMDETYGWSDAAFEAALRGGDDAPALLTAFSAAAVMELTDPIADDVARHHIATSAAVARSVAHEAAATAAAPAASSSRKQRRRLRRLTFAGAFSGMWAKIALGTAALATVGTGAAVTDTLPDPLQAVFSDVANAVGVDLPHPDDALVEEGVETDEGVGTDDAVTTDSDSGETTKTVGPSDPESLPPGGGASEEGRTRAQEIQDWQACKDAAEAAELDADAECGEKPPPPGQVKNEDKDTGPPEDNPGNKDKDKDTGKPDDTPGKGGDNGKPDKDK